MVIRWWYRTQYAPAKHGQGGSSSTGSDTKLTTWLRSKGRGSASTNSSGEIVQRATLRAVQISTPVRRPACFALACQSCISAQLELPGLPTAAWVTRGGPPGLKGCTAR